MLDYKLSNFCGILYNSGNIQFTNDENDILLSPIGNKVNAFDLKNGVSSTFPFETRSNISHIEVSPDSKLLVVVDIDGYCIIVNLLKKIIIGHFNFRSKVTSMKISNDAKFIAVGCEKSLRIFELPVMKKEFEPLLLYKHFTHFHNDAITNLNWSNDSRFVITSSKDATFRLCNIMKIKDYTPFLFTGHKKKIVNAVFSEDNERIFSISKDGMLFIWKLEAERSEEFKKRLEFNKMKSNRNMKSKIRRKIEKINETEENEDADEDEEKEKEVEEEKFEEILQADREENEDFDEEFYTEFEKKIQSGRYILEKKQQFVINGKITCFELNKHSSIIVLGLDSGVFCIYDINTFENKYTLQISDQKINSLTISKKGLWLGFGSKKLGQLIVWEWKSESYIFKQQGHFFDVTCIAYSPDGSLIASGGQDGKIKLWDITNSSCIVTFTDHSSKVTDLKFATNKANILVSSSLDGTVRAYDLVKYKNFRIMTTSTPTQLISLAVNFSGEIVCAGGMDPFSIYIWSLKTGDLVEILNGHTGPVNCLAFSKIKDFLVSGSWDKTVKTWELYSKGSFLETFDHTHEVVSIDISPNDSEVSSCTLNGEIYNWDITVGAMKNIIDCSRDIWGGRQRADKAVSKKILRNKHFNSINYNASGNIFICGGNSQFLCLYDSVFQILIKRFRLTSNRSLDGLLHKLNSKNVTEAGEDDLLNNENSDDSEFEDVEDLPGTKQAIHKGKKFNLPVKIVSVKFSPSNRSWAAATTEGIYIYSLDTTMNFSPLTLDIDVTPNNAVRAFNDKNYIKAIIYAIYLNKANLIEQFIFNIPEESIVIACNRLPLNAVVPLLNFLAKKIENDNKIQLMLIWVVNLVKFHGQNLKNKKNKNVFLNLNKSIAKQAKGILNILDENTSTISFINQKFKFEKEFENLKEQNDVEMN